MYLASLRLHGTPTKILLCPNFIQIAHVGDGLKPLKNKVGFYTLSNIEFFRYNLLHLNSITNVIILQVQREARA